MLNQAVRRIDRKYGDAWLCVCANWGGGNQAKAKPCLMCVQGKGNDQPDAVEDSAAWVSSYTPQTWKPEVCMCLDGVHVCALVACFNTTPHLL